MNSAASLLFLTFLVLSDFQLKIKNPSRLAGRAPAVLYPIAAHGRQSILTSIFP
jgi:hypothetical protein